jgi:hypothetical protein
VRGIRARRTSSPCNDSGEDAIVTSGLLRLTEDIDAEDRTLDLQLAGGASVLDRGSDEFTIRFQRGDTNSDNTVNMADVITLLNYLFSGGLMQNCLDAADVNDDGIVNITDPMNLLSALFPPPGVPPYPIPPPYPGCGFDAVPDTLAPCLDADPSHTPCP